MRQVISIGSCRVILKGLQRDIRQHNAKYGKDGEKGLSTHREQ